MGAVASVVEAVSDVGEAVTKTIIEPVIQTVQSVVENPQALATVALAVAAPGVGTAIGSALGASGVAATALGNAVIGGTLSSASGGNFGEGAVAGGVGSLVGGYATPAISETLGGGTLGNVGASAITGGTLSELQGGDFLQGALQSGLTSGINESKQAAVEDYLQGIESTYAPAQGPTEADILSILQTEQPIFVPTETTFTPDYSLVPQTTIPEMGAQGIQTPTITEIIKSIEQPISTPTAVVPSEIIAPNVTSPVITPEIVPTEVASVESQTPTITEIIKSIEQPVDYSLPSIPSNVGLQIPTTPSVESMGGQGIVIPVDNGYVNESGFVPEIYIPSLGNTESFINQTLPTTDLVVQQPISQPTDINKELAALDVAKALAPMIVGSLLANQMAQPSPEPSGFGIVPIPGDWRSPEYNMAFTPSAPIDFGNLGLLKGTQFERPSSLSDVINTINQQSTNFGGYAPKPFPTNFDVNDIVGAINSQPMSISDIIANIQSQYGQTT